jgi:hypothetical protein
MNKLNLKKRKIRGYYSYDCIVDEPIIRTEWDWFGDGYNDAYEVLKSARNFNVFPFTGFDIVLFPILAWEITNKLSRYGCLVFDTDGAIDHIGRDVDFRTKWEYEYCTGEEWTGEPIGKEGYVKSRGRDSGVFLLQSIDDLFELQVASLGDKITEINLYTIEPSKVGKLKSLLSRRLRVPTIRKILTTCSIFVDFVYSLESEYSHGMTIKSKEDISSVLIPVLDDLDKRICNFENELNNTKTVEKYLNSLERFVCGSQFAS